MAEETKKERKQAQVNVWLDADLVEMLDVMREADYLKRTPFVGSLIRAEWNRRYGIPREIKKVKTGKSARMEVSA